MVKLFKSTKPALKKLTAEDISVEISDLSVYFGKKTVLRDISIVIPKHRITIG